MALKFFAKKEDVPSDKADKAIELADKRWALDEPEENLQTALDKERDNATRSEKARKKAQDEVDRLSREAAARGTGATEEQLTKIRNDLELSYKPIKEENETLKAANRKLSLTDRVKAYALKHGIMPDRIDDGMLLLEKRTDLGDAGGIIVNDKDGKATAETIDDFLSKTFKAEKPWLYKGSGSSGSGAEGSEGAIEGVPTGKSKDEQMAAKRSQHAGAL